jgi:hypothetical protein
MYPLLRIRLKGNATVLDADSTFRTGFSGKFSRKLLTVALGLT